MSSAIRSRTSGRNRRSASDIVNLRSSSLSEQERVISAPSAASSRSISNQISVEPAKPGDQAVIHGILRAVFHGPSEVEFHSTSDHPNYKPSNRLLAKCDGRTIGQVHLDHRKLYFGDAEVAVTSVDHLAILPEYQKLGAGSLLMREVERRSRLKGSALVCGRTVYPEFPEKYEWMRLKHRAVSTAAPRAVLSALELAPSQRVRRSGRVKTGLVARRWRHVEQDELRELYEPWARAHAGSQVRSEEYWRWLLARHAHEYILVAEDRSAGGKIVGYAVIRRGSLIELVSERDDARNLLLARFCMNAIEQGHHSVRMHAPPIDPIHSLVRDMDRPVESKKWRVALAKLISLELFVDAMSESWLRLLNGRNIDLGIHCGSEKYQIAVVDGRTQLTEGRIGRSYIRLNRRQLTSLILGQLDLDDADVVKPSTRTAIENTKLLFPMRKTWRPPLDDLRIT